MNSPSDGSQTEEDFLGKYIAKMNPELYMGDQIAENVNAPGDNSIRLTSRSCSQLIIYYAALKKLYAA